MDTLTMCVFWNTLVQVGVEDLEQVVVKDVGDDNWDFSENFFKASDFFWIFSKKSRF
jgi:hypothetical protein